MMTGAQVGKGITGSVSTGARNSGQWIQSQTATEASAFGMEQAAYAKEFQANESRNRSHYEAWRNDVLMRRTQGNMTQSFAASGVDYSGASIDAIAAAMKEMTMDKSMQIRNSQAERAALAAEARDLRKSAKYMRESQEFASTIQGIGTAAEGIGAWFQ